MINKQAHICILGGGFGGVFTALYLKGLGWRTSPQITLIDEKDHFLFTPLLYELVTGELKTWQLAPLFSKLLGGRGINFKQARVENVDLQNRCVTLDDQTILSYDRLVIATGKETLLDVVAGAAEYAIPFRSLADVRRLRERLRFLETSELTKIRVCIVGAGPNGVELACKLADRLKSRGEIVLISRHDKILKNFALATQKSALRCLGRRGILLELQSSVESVDKDFITVVKNNQRCLQKADLVVWTTGTKTADWVKNLSQYQMQQKELMVLPTLQLMEFPEVFALGDIATANVSKDAAPATAQAAFQQAKVAAKNIRASLMGKNLQKFRYRHLGEMLTLGIGVSAISSFGVHFSGRVAGVFRQWFYLLRMPTFRHRFKVAKAWILRLISSP
ncbi:FAD-dependent oxidoreductase [Ancylothrix sp. C2]|uniref:NAD(P)/FAD-dependent oxidoreductase n=1 Tax=Ancylothrix sp. D3o TaxID=2953691 RepID=UPI0021BB993C|nr:FAD-dependent oxidoreductase [Ancylothrix sp. D3o]MCT7951687.1 FAD-dependent oxidoreductase [Ancylothrix sp. D3o]